MNPELVAPAILLAVAVTLHNIEEMIWLPGFRHPGWLSQMDVAPYPFRRAALVVTAIFWLAALGMAAGWPLQAVMTGLAATMLFNAVLPHLALTLRMRRYHPGTATAWLLVVPAAVVYIAAAFHLFSDGNLSFMTGVIAGALLLVVVVPASLKLFEWRERRRAR